MATPALVKAATSTGTTRNAVASRDRAPFARPAVGVFGSLVRCGGGVDAAVSHGRRDDCLVDALFEPPPSIAAGLSATSTTIAAGCCCPLHFLPSSTAPMLFERWVSCPWVIHWCFGVLFV